MANDYDDDIDAGSFYCKECGGCGYIGCDGIRSFLEKHVKGKTDCSEEASFIAEIIEFVEDHENWKINHDPDSWPDLSTLESL